MKMKNAMGGDIMEQEEQRPQERRVKNQNEKAAKKIKLVKVEFDFSKKQEEMIYQQLQDQAKEINKNRTACKIKPADIIKLAIPKISESDILELKQNTLSKKDKLALWTKNFNIENNTSYTSEEFAVDVLPVLSGKDLKRLQEISL